MPPDLGAEDPAAPSEAHPVISATGPQQSGRAPPLHALSAATTRYSANTPAPPHVRRRPSITLSVVSGLVVGAAVVFAMPIPHRFGATLRIVGHADPSQSALIARQLLEYAWQESPNRQQSKGDPDWWRVETAGEARLRLVLTTSDPGSGVAVVRVVAEGFLRTLADRQAKTRATVTQAERILSEVTEALRARLDDARRQVEVADRPLPFADPRNDHATLLASWQELRESFFRQTGRVAAELAGLARLHDEPEPIQAIIPTPRRQQALKEDAALQQDLAELTVRLAEAKLHMLNVWQRARAPLEDLIIAARDFAGLRLQQDLGATDRSRLLATLETAGGDYRDRLALFTELWNKEFITLKGREVDPLSRDLLVAHSRSRLLLNEFLFQGSRQLQLIRDTMGILGQSSSTQVKYHVLESNLIRSFQTLQLALDRLEFATSGLELRDNFRLDSALRGARGLGRRTQHRIGLIDQRLRAEALEQARARRVKELAEAKQRLEQARNDANRAADQLVALQDKLNNSAGLAEEFLRQAHQVELAKMRLELTQADTLIAADRLSDLKAERTSRSPGAPLELVSCQILPAQAYLKERLSIGGIAGVLTILLVFLGQWWIRR